MCNKSQWQYVCVKNNNEEMDFCTSEFAGTNQKANKHVAKLGIDK